MADRMQASLAAVRDRGEWRGLRPVVPLAGGRLARDAAALVDFSSNDYLGLARDPRLAARAGAWVEADGVGAGASRLVTGTRAAHVRLEARIAAWKGTGAALLFSSGWQCNAAVLAALLRAAPDAQLFTDRLIHHSLHAGAAGRRQHRFRHNDLDHLARLLAAAAPGPRIVVTESVFSMDGDRTDIAALVALARRFDAFVYLDEAHAAGVLGPAGRGLAATVPGGVDLAMGTFSKAFGAFGAYVAGSPLVIDYLVNACGGFIFSTAPPPALLGAIDAGLDLVPGMDAARAHLAALGDRLRAMLRAGGVAVAGDTQIVAPVVGGADAAVALSAGLAGDGFLVAAIRPPTVPPGSSRLRIALHADHTPAEVDALAAAILRRWPG